MKFATVITYSHDAERVAAIRPAHREYLTQLLSAGKLVAAGPFLDDSGALIIYEAESPEEAERLIRNDPFHAEGIFVRYELRAWKAVFGNRGLLPDGGP
jgi:uncharacterized protein YciI